MDTNGDTKMLLLKDLCSRLPYGLIVEATYKDGEGWKTEDRKLLSLYTDGQVYADSVYTSIEHTKPYLRPMSSMTEEELNEYENFITNEKDDQLRFCNELVFYNRHHFDYRGLIEKGLALEAPEGMYNIK